MGGVGGEVGGGEVGEGGRVGEGKGWKGEMVREGGEEGGGCRGLRGWSRSRGGGGRWAWGLVGGW